MSPEHWAFLKYWKEVFPSAEVWSVPGPHRRLMGVEVSRQPQVNGLRTTAVVSDVLVVYYEITPGAVQECVRQKFYGTGGFECTLYVSGCTVS